jgi:hypothetical protein
VPAFVYRLIAPRDTPAGSYGLGLLIADDMAGAEALREADPAILARHGLLAEISPMPRLITPTGVYDAA